MDLRQLEAFVAVATLRSFRAAANRLRLTQPAISSRISSLEAEIGESLFVRDRRPVALTDRARLVLPYAEQMLDLSQHVKPLGAATSSKAIEMVRIGTNSSLINAWLPQLSWYLHEKMPNLAIEYEVGASHRLRDRMMAGALDVSLMHAPGDVPGIRRQRLGELQPIWAARPGVLPGGRLPVSDLAKYFVVTFGSDSETYNGVEAAFRRIGAWPAPHLSTNYADLVVSTIKRTPSIGTVLRDSIKAELRSGELVELKSEVKLKSYEIHVCHSLTKRNSTIRKLSELTVDFYTRVRPTL